jgi:hypothetical protein
MLGDSLGIVPTGVQGVLLVTESVLPTGHCSVSFLMSAWSAPPLPGSPPPQIVALASVT